MYGASDSPLHGGLPTDRFETEWQLASERVRNVEKGNPPDRPGWERLPRSNRAVPGENGLLTCQDDLVLDISEQELLVEIPGTITDMMASDKGLALDWRMKTRRLLVHYLDKGYWVTGFHRSDERSFYRLSQSSRVSGLE